MAKSRLRPYSPAAEKLGGHVMNSGDLLRDSDGIHLALAQRAVVCKQVILFRSRSVPLTPIRLPYCQDSATSVTHATVIAQPPTLDANNAMESDD